MGLADNKRFAPFIYRNSGTGSSSGRNAFSDGARGINLSGGTDPTSEGGNFLTKRPSGRFCLPTILGPQKGWWIPLNSELEGYEQLHPRGALQDGRVLHGERSGETGRLVSKIDLKDAYFLIPVHPCHQKFLQFTWKESLYQFQCLPFGLLCAP